MKKLILLFILLSITINGFCQTTAFSASKYGSILIECFYTLKESSEISLSEDCRESMKQRIGEFNTYLQGQLQTHRSNILRKLGPDDLKDLEGLLKGYQRYSSTDSSTISQEQQMSMDVWIELSKVIATNLFIKLQKP